MAYMATDPEV
jgi:uncharacterized protein (TIGR02266 family)